MSMWIRVGLIVIGAAVLVAVLVAAVRSGKPIRRMLTSGVQGLCALGAVNVLGTFTGVSLGFSWLSAGVCVVLGLPGVIGMLLLKLIFPS